MDITPDMNDYRSNADGEKHNPKDHEPIAIFIQQLGIFEGGDWCKQERRYGEKPYKRRSRGDFEKSKELIHEWRHFLSNSIIEPN